MQISFCFRVEDLKYNQYNFVFRILQTHNIVKMSDSTLNDVGLFIASLLDFNDLNLNAEFVDSLFITDELALEGGLLFKSNNICISASCCSDFQDWINVVNNIKEKKSPWMGHDPSPWFEFDNRNITLWSDEIDRQEINDLDRLQFTQKEFTSQLLEAKEELNKFLQIVKQWSDINYPTDAERLTSGIKNYLLI